jgi:NAD(P)H-hydrate epimerase
MSDRTFYTPTGTPVRAITAEQMRKVDRIAVDEFGLGILQMMENAGRSLALHVVELLGQLTPCVENAHRPEDGEMSQDTSKETSRKTSEDTVVVFAGSGGNGGGGLCCARHLHNRGVNVNVALSKDASRLTGAARTQLDTLQAAGLRPLAESEVPSALARASVVVDALIGYSLRGAPRGRTAAWIALCNANKSRAAYKMLSLDVPSGLNATTGETPGVAIRPDRTLTLALPKTGLHSIPGELYLVDIGIPPEVYHCLGLALTPIFRDCYWIELRNTYP